MNTKVAKAIRRQIKYHPTQPRTYEQVARSNKKAKAKKLTTELTADTSRYMYQQLKKEYYG